MYYFLLFADLTMYLLYSLPPHPHPLSTVKSLSMMVLLQFLWFLSLAHVEIHRYPTNPLTAALPGFIALHGYRTERKPLVLLDEDMFPYAQVMDHLYNIFKHYREPGRRVPV